MTLASWVLNLQLMEARATFRSVTRDWTSRRRASSSGSRCLRQERDSTLNSISAMFRKMETILAQRTDLIVSRLTNYEVLR